MHMPILLHLLWLFRLRVVFLLAHQVHADLSAGLRRLQLPGALALHRGMWRQTHEDGGDGYQGVYAGESHTDLVKSGKSLSLNKHTYNYGLYI